MIDAAKMENKTDDAKMENKTNLIVNYVPQELTDEEFQALFAKVGPLKSGKVCRNKATNYSYGFGFVDYYTEEDAQKAIDELNGLQVKQKRIKVALARPPEESRKGAANIFVRNIPRHYTEVELREVFSPCGKIIQCKVLKDKVTGQSKAAGFVLFDKKNEADKALEQLNGQTPAGGNSPLLMKYANDGIRKGPNFPQGQQMYGGGGGGGGPMRGQAGSRQSSRYNPLATGDGNTTNFYTDTFDTFGQNSGAPAQTPTTTGSLGQTLFVHNVGYHCFEHELWEMFSVCGNVQKVDVMWDYSMQRCKGYAFVTMSSEAEATNAIDMVHGTFFKGRRLAVSLKKETKANINTSS